MVPAGIGGIACSVIHLVADETGAHMLSPLPG